MARRKTEQDKGFAWIILIVTMVANMIEASVFMSPAVYLVAWDNAFDVSKAQLGLAGSLLNGMTCIAGREERFVMLSVYISICAYMKISNDYLIFAPFFISYFSSCHIA